MHSITHRDTGNLQTDVCSQPSRERGHSCYRLTAQCSQKESREDFVLGPEDYSIERTARKLGVRAARTFTVAKFCLLN